MSNPSALSNLDAHERRIQSLEQESRETASDLARQGSSLEHLGEMLEVKLNDLRKDNAAVATTVCKLDEKLDSITSDIQTINHGLTKDSSRIASLEELKFTIDSHLKWVKRVLAGFLITAIGYVIKEFIGHAWK